MRWLEGIKCEDGLEEASCGRLVSYINGDTQIQLAGFFTPCELCRLAWFVRWQGQPPQNAQPQQCPQQCAPPE